MAQFRLRIAGHTAAVTSLFESTPHYFRPYLAEDEPEFSITVTWEDVEFERRFCTAEAIAEGFRFRDFPDTYLERAAVQRKFADHLFPLGIILFHGSAIAVEGEGYLFTARSGTGKSTHTRLWRECFGSRAVMVNDDKPFLEFSAGGVLVHGSPWSGKHGLDANICVPLKGICILERGSENRIRPMDAQEALPMLQKQSSPPSDPAQLYELQQRVQALARTVPLWHMTCTRDPQAARVAAGAMGCKI